MLNKNPWKIIAVIIANQSIKFIPKKNVRNICLSSIAGSTEKIAILIK